MATYTELHGLFGNTEVRNRVEVAAVIAAQGILDGGSATEGQVAWARSVLATPRAVAVELWAYVLAKNKGAATAAITGASDSSIQSNVDAAAAVLKGA